MIKVYVKALKSYVQGPFIISLMSDTNVLLLQIQHKINSINYMAKDKNNPVLFNLAG